jgi:hypothetical protein
MMFLDELFLDIYDGRLSNSLAEATAMTRDLGVETTYSAFSSLLEAQTIATEVAERERLRFVATETCEMLIHDLREHFLDAAEELFIEFWQKSEAKGIGKAEEIKSRFRAIRVLKLARDQAIDEEQKARLEERYRENIDRLIGISGTIKSAEDTARDYWQAGRKGAAVDMLRAGIIWHESAKLRVGTDVLQKRLKQYTSKYSGELMELARGTQDPQKAEGFAVQAVKVYAVGHGLDSGMLREVWAFAKRAVEAKFDQVRKTIKKLSASGRVNEGIELIKSSIWFLPANLEKEYKALETVLVKQGIEHFLAKSRAAKKLSAKIAPLDEALNVLAQHLEPNHPIKLRASKLKKLRRILTDTLASAKDQMASKRYPEVVAGFKGAESQARIFVKENKEPLSSADLSSLTALSKKAEKALALAQAKLASSERAGVSTEGWKLAAEALNIYPHSFEAETWKDTIEDNLALPGDILKVECAGSKYLWFARKHLNMARNGGDLPLSLWSLSSDKQPLQFRLEAGQPVVIDHNSRYGIFRRVDSKSKADLEIKGGLYQRCLPQRPSPLKGQGELLAGMIGRIIWRTVNFGLILTFENPYQPREVDKSVRETLEELWPRWREDTAKTVVLAPVEISLGGNSSEAVVLPGDESGSVTIKKDDDRFLISATPGPLVAQGTKVDRTLLMADMTFRIGKSKLRFSVR